MGKRLIIYLAGAALGAWIGSTLNDSLGLSAAATMAICSLAGVAIGYVAATLVEVFTAKPHPLGIRSNAD